ncbi:MAG: pyruvate kinase [Planctomycetaceae bacterium]|jgi:pyruvate kinase
MELNPGVNMAITTQINLLKYRRTKIVATVGPASSSPEMLTGLIEAGVNVFRLNMSHGDHAAHTEAYHHIRRLALELDRPVGILADLCGPKIRTGKFAGDSIRLVTGERITITTRDVMGEAGLIPSQYKALAADVKVDNRILLADGLLELQVESKTESDVICRVIHGGELGNHKGINLPGVEVSAPAMTEKDFADAEFALDLGVDYIALSFVRQAKDLAPLRAMIDSHQTDARIISKIEKPEALENADDILDASDGIMVARGDLGVELPAEQVPVAQTQLIDLSRSKGKPVIVATQMLESMVTNSRPTRAEVTDVSHAVEHGADAIMLSGETAMGLFPEEAVRTMHRVARQTEAHLWRDGVWGHGIDQTPNEALPIWTVIANAAAQISRQIMASGVMVVTKGGTSAATVSTARPAAPIVAITSDQRALQRMSLLWGVIPVMDESAGKSNPNELARSTAEALGLAEVNDSIVLVRGFNVDPVLNTPSVTVINVSPD